MANLAIELSNAMAAAVRAAEPSVVRVVREGGPSRTGLIWDDEGRILTTSSGLYGDDGDVVLAGGETRRVRLVGRDPGTDLALLAGDGGDWQPASLVEPDELAVGQPALALGRPGRGIRASLRILGVLGSDVRTPGGGTLERYVETDRALPRGFAGGPLIDVRGRVIGVSSRAVVPGADVAITAPTLRRIVAALRAHGSPRRGYLGVGAWPARLPRAIAAQLGADGGALVVSVAEGGPAEAAGLVMGDVIVAVAGDPVAGPRDLAAALSGRGGQTVAVRLLRAGALTEIDVAVGERG